MKKKIVVFIIVFSILISGVVVVIEAGRGPERGGEGGSLNEELLESCSFTEEDLNETDASDPLGTDLEEGTDIPNWGVGSSWTYEHEVSMEIEDKGELRGMKEEITYRVEDIGYHTYDENTYYSYNLSLGGDIEEGEGEFEGFDVVIEDGDISGYLLLRVSDLGVIVDHQDRYIEGEVEGLGVGFDGDITLIRDYSPIVEEFDFPLEKDKTFWANTTMETFGYYEFVAVGGLIQKEGDFYEFEEIKQTYEVSPELKEVEVPGGTYSTYEVKNSMESGVSQWYNDTVGWSVIQSAKFNADEFKADIERKLIEFDLKTPGHSQEIEPNPHYIGENVTISGHMKGYGDTTLWIYIPYSSGQQNWTVETDDEGYYELTLQAPLINDNTPTPSYHSSEGIITSVADDKNEKIVTTLVSMRGEREEMYDLTISVEGKGRTDPPEGSHTYEKGEEVTITAIASEEWYFEEWTGNHTSTEEEINITMDEDIIITANFDEEEGEMRSVIIGGIAITIAGPAVIGYVMTKNGKGENEEETDKDHSDEDVSGYDPED